MRMNNTGSALAVTHKGVTYCQFFSERKNNIIPSNASHYSLLVPETYQAFPTLELFEERLRHQTALKKCT
jgi:hypothetical protein